MKTNYVLVDCENVHAPAISLLKGEQFRVILFLGPNNSKLKKALRTQVVHERLERIDMAGSGKNALDFHIAYYVGKLASEDPSGRFHIISKDKGFDLLIRHLQTRHISIARLKSIEAMSVLQSKKNPNTPRAIADENKLLEKFMATLQKKKTAKPGTLKALRNSIRSDCGKDLPEKTIESVYKAFLKTSHVQVQKERLQYSDL
jgi:hypothetical protein